MVPSATLSGCPGQAASETPQTLSPADKCAQILAGYSLDGTAQVDYATLSFIAPAWCLLQARIRSPSALPPHIAAPRGSQSSACCAGVQPAAGAMRDRAALPTCGVLGQPRSVAASSILCDTCRSVWHAGVCCSIASVRLLALDESLQHILLQLLTTPDREKPCLPWQ